MSLTGALGELARGRFPRVSGDEPAFGRSPPLVHEFSPRERG